MEWLLVQAEKELKAWGLPRELRDAVYRYYGAAVRPRAPVYRKPRKYASKREVADVQRRIAEIRLYGPRTHEDLVLIYAINNGLLNPG
jgi:hypothetical protein